MIDWDITSIEMIFNHFNKKELLDDFKKYNFVNFGDYSLLFEEYKVDDITVYHNLHPDYKYDRNSYVLTISHGTQGTKYQLNNVNLKNAVLEMLGYIKMEIPMVQPTLPQNIQTNDEICQVLQSGIYAIEYEGSDGNPYQYENENYDISLVRFKYASGYEDYVQVRDRDGSMIFETPKRQVKIFFKDLNL